MCDKNSDSTGRGRRCYHYPARKEFTKGGVILEGLLEKTLWRKSVLRNKQELSLTFSLRSIGSNCRRVDAVLNQTLAYPPSMPAIKELVATERSQEMHG